MEIIKLIIYIFILIASSSIGIIYSNKFKKRVDELKDFKTALNMLKTKIRFTYAPLKEIFEDISNSLKSKTSNVFFNICKNMKTCDVAESWTRSLQETETNITKEDKQIISGFGKMLGKTDLDGQLNEIELSLNFLESQIEKAEEDKRKNVKLYKSLGVIVGVGLVIILL